MVIIGGIAMNKEDNYHLRYASFYNSKEWHELRMAKWVSANGLCELCLKNGIINEAREIHHIVPIEKDWSKRLDYDNLLALCSDCHNQQHLRISPLQKFFKSWETIENKEDKK